MALDKYKAWLTREINRLQSYWIAEYSDSWGRLEALKEALTKYTSLSNPTQHKPTRGRTRGHKKGKK